jgi:uncharacterized protein
MAKKPTHEVATTRALSRKLAKGAPIDDVEVVGDGRRAGVDRLYNVPISRIVDNLQNFVAGLGTKGDKRSHSFYNFPLTLTRVELENMFRSSWLAKRIVMTPADDMFRAGWELTWDGYEEDTDGAKAVQTAVKNLQLNKKCNEAEAWGRLYGGTGIVVDIKGQEDWSKPLDLNSIKKGMLRSLHVLDRWRLAPIGEIDYDRPSANYGYPSFYTISDQGDPRFRVHHSRVIRFSGEPLPYFLFTQNAYWQDSVLQHVAETIRDYDATLAGIASMVYEANVDIITSPQFSAMLASPGGEQKVIKRWGIAALMKSMNHMMILDGGKGTPDSKGEEYTQKTTQFSGLKDVVEKFMINVCGAADIPMTRLFGQSPAGLTATGESDIRNYYDRISADQEKKIRPGLEKLLEIVIRSTLGRMPENVALTFKPLWQMSDKEKAEIEKLRAERDQIYLLQGTLMEHTITARLLELKTYGNALTQKDVDLIERMAKLAQMSGDPGTPGRPLPGGKAAPKSGRPTEPAGNSEPNPERGSGADRALDVIRKKPDGYHLYSQNGKKHLGGPYTREELAERIAEVEGHKKDAA